MLDLTETGVAAWFSAVRPATRQNHWPPALRPVERAPGVELSIEALAKILSEIEEQEPSCMVRALAVAKVRQDLQLVLAQLGAARLLRIADWLVSTLSEGPRLLAELSHGRTANADAINSALRALTARATLARMFSLDRVAELQSYAEAASNPEETP